MKKQPRKAFSNDLRVKGSNRMFQKEMNKKGVSYLEHLVVNHGFDNDHNTCPGLQGWLGVQRWMTQQAIQYNWNITATSGVTFIPCLVMPCDKLVL